MVDDGEEERRAGISRATASKRQLEDSEEQGEGVRPRAHSTRRAKTTTPITPHKHTYTYTHIDKNKKHSLVTVAMSLGGS